LSLWRSREFREDVFFKKREPKELRSLRRTFLIFSLELLDSLGSVFKIVLLRLLFHSFVSSTLDSFSLPGLHRRRKCRPQV
jgi:hypothetical protein